MKLEKLFDTAFFCYAGYAFASGVLRETAVHTIETGESPITLLKTAAVLYPLAISIGFVTKKIFDYFDLNNKYPKLALCSFIWINVASVMWGAAEISVRMGLTSCKITAARVYLITIMLIAAGVSVTVALINICTDKHYKIPKGVSIGITF